MNKKAKNSGSRTGERKFRLLLDYWIKHNREHASELEQWRARLTAEGWESAARELNKAIKSAGDIDHYLEAALNKISDRKEKKVKFSPTSTEENNLDLKLRKIGTIHTPYHFFAPYQPRESGEGEFIIEVDSAYRDGLYKLEEFSYIYVLYYLHQQRGALSLKVIPPWTDQEVGLFASRSPYRPNPLGLSVVKLLRQRSNRLFTSDLDIFDGTPLLDLKPYLQELDSKADADYGWLSGSESREHLLLHIRGIPH